MENKVRVTLPDKFIAQLVQMPETGMGYQIVDIVLTNGKVLKNIIIFNSSILEIEKEETFNIEDIVIIKIHKE